MGEGEKDAKGDDAAGWGQRCAGMEGRGLRTVESTCLEFAEERAASSLGRLRTDRSSSCRPILSPSLETVGEHADIQVANEETVLAVAFFIILYAIGKNIGAPYSEWANDHINRIRNILNGAREEHTSAVSQRLQGLDAIKEVVPLTEQLYSVAKETNQLEHANFLLQQEAEVKNELKSVLDSWVRYEQQAREAEQQALVKTVEANIASELAKPAFKKSLLEEAISEIERIAKKGN